MSNEEYYDTDNILCPKCIGPVEEIAKENLVHLYLCKHCGARFFMSEDGKYEKDNNK